MKFLIAFVALFALALAAPPANNADVTIVKSAADVGVDNFSYAFETSDGNKQEAAGHLENAGAEDEAIAVRGSYSFIGDDGVTYLVNYVADKNGFQPEGAHLPVAPVA